MKRLFDVACVVIIFSLFWWVMLLLAVAIKLSSPGPVVFGHPRVGKDGRIFKCYKFRSMVSDAESALKRLLESDAEAREEWARDFKLKNDPRITRVGQFIRRRSLDELPQLWNVLVGDMSVVGPRPVISQELDQHYGAAQADYLSVRPGLTGLWQVSGRNDIDYNERVKLDQQYVRSWTVWGDFAIVMKTVGVVLRPRGAY